MEDWRTRFILLAMAAGGTVAYAVVLFGPVAGLLLLNPWTAYYGPWPALVAMAVLAWVLAPRHGVHGIELARDEAPALFDAADELASRIGAPRIDGVRLVDELNAAALEEPVRWPPWRRRRTLLLGVPLLALADTGAARSVIAHELGHFSRRHGRLGQWLYRVRVRWLAYAELTGPDVQVSLWERGAAAFAGWFAPRFSRRSFGWARRCEFEADALGAAVVGATRMAAALFQLDVLAERWRRLEQQGLPALIAERETPPEAWLSEVRREVLATPPSADDWQQLGARTAGEHDTHPALAERVAALGVELPSLLAGVAWSATPAGEAWLRDWPTAVARHDAAWREARAASWRSEHLRARHQRTRLEALREAGDESAERCRLELQFGEAVRAAEIATRLTSDPEAAFVLGQARLRQGDAAGLATLESLVTRDAAWAAPARAAMAHHEALFGDEAARRRNRALLERARHRRGEAGARIHADVPLARLAPARLEGGAATVLRDVLAGWPAVAGAWCATTRTEEAGRAFDAVVLVLRLRAALLDGTGRSEDDLAYESRSLLDGLLPPNALHLVWPAYTTEPLTPELDALLEGWARSGDAACLVAPPSGECAPPGVRASALG